MSGAWFIDADVRRGRGVLYVGTHAALLWESEGFAYGSFDVLQDFAIRDLVAMAADFDAAIKWSEKSSEDPPALFIDISFTAKEYFEQEINDALFRPGDVQLVVTLDGNLWVRAGVFNESAYLEWPEMEDILGSWGKERGCKLEYLLPARTNLPHLWEVSFFYPVIDATISEACEFAKDVTAVVQAFRLGSLDHAALRALVRAGRASALIGLSEGSLLEAKRPKKLDDLSAKLELAKDVGAMANTSSGGMILIGADTKRVGGHDIIRRLCGFSVGALDRQIIKTLRQYIYPAIVDLHVERASAGDGGQILLIDVPAQPEVLKPFIVHGIEGGGKQIYFSIPQREGEDTFFMTVAELHGRLLAARAWLDGRSHGSTDSFAITNGS
ncbi:MAG: ATP-binding protein [Actinomycetota bacterium]|nr:ATP-binding protein [Actinomycetota bacterium]